MAIIQETKVEYLTFSRSLHELENTLAYYNYEGTHFRVFNSYDDALDFVVKGNEEIIVIADFETEEDLDSFLENCEICTVCGKVCLPDDECYSDNETGDACCTECCFYDESNDMYVKGTIEDAYYKTKLEIDTLKETPTVFYSIQQFDIHFNSMLAEFGMFIDRDKAIEAMMHGFEELYAGFKKDVYENGSNQWITDNFDFAVQLTEIEINNTFGEI
ncbi:hypothetical protein SAMN06313486_10186 [Epsilonproteobacteria bacterium SCGC AD-308-P11]|jgi:hypothetical protein|nr:hypothetical protein SAMN06313486_10186 [Epsilonproteobacteria bacterium SCGC AD-308-P11]